MTFDPTEERLDVGPQLALATRDVLAASHRGDRPGVPGTVEGSERWAEWRGRSRGEWRDLENRENKRKWMEMNINEHPVYTITVTGEKL